MTSSPVAASVSTFGATEGWDVAIVVPAKDEAARITDCLSAISVSADSVCKGRVGLVLVVNNSTDATAELARDWASMQRTPALVVDHHFSADQAGVGSSRRLGIDLAMRSLRGNGTVMMTDADTHVTPSWVAENVADLKTADVVCGVVNAIPAEQAALPVEISRHGAWESDYVAASLKLAALLDPMPHDRNPAHHNAAGASMAFRTSVYQSVGGIPPLTMGEDRAFVALAEAQDFRIRYSDRPVVRTSCRMIGRTDGGMAGALRERRDAADPRSDEWLEPAQTFYLRYALRGALRSVWPSADAIDQVLVRYMGRAGLSFRVKPLPVYFGAFIQQIEACSPQLDRVRMRQSDCRRELPMLLNLLAARLTKAQPYEVFGKRGSANDAPISI